MKDKLVLLKKYLKIYGLYAGSLFAIVLGGKVMGVGYPFVIDSEDKYNFQEKIITSDGTSSVRVSDKPFDQKNYYVDKGEIYFSDNQYIRDVKEYSIPDISVDEAYELFTKEELDFTLLKEYTEYLYSVDNSIGDEVHIFEKEKVGEVPESDFKNIASTLVDGLLFAFTIRFLREDQKEEEKKKIKK